MNGFVAIRILRRQQAISGAHCRIVSNANSLPFQNPIVAHGLCLFNDGRLMVFKDDTEEASRIHAMQIWETPYFHEEFMTASSIQAKTAKRA